VSSPRAPFTTITAIGDFDGDGRNDLAAVTYDPNQPLVILPGNGDGTFRAPVAVPLAIKPASMIAMDFDEDGRADLLVADAFDGTLKTLRNQPAGPVSSSTINRPPQD
jgi:hypothetical protein